MILADCDSEYTAVVDHGKPSWVIRDGMVQGTTDNPPSEDLVNHPDHYVSGRKFEPIDVILDWDLSFCAGQVLKYLSRYGRKGDAVEDLKKARFYLDREIALLEGK